MEIEMENEMKIETFNWTTEDDLTDTTQPDYDEYYDTEDELVDFTNDSLSVSSQDIQLKYNSIYTECCKRLEVIHQIKPFTFEIIELRVFLQKLKDILNYILNHYKLDTYSINSITSISKQYIPLNEKIILEKSILIFQHLFNS